MKLKWILSFLLSIAVFLMGRAFAESPPFDYDKARQLSPEKRREYDVIFANEMAIWGSNSNRYIDEYIVTHREEEAKLLVSGYHHRRRIGELAAMAKDGYLPAYVVLRLYGNGLQLIEDEAALKMLIYAAEQGDLSAMCAVIPTSKEFEEKVSGYVQAKEKFLTRGAELGHGRCLAVRGGRAAWHFDTLPDGVTPNHTLADVDKALPDLYEAARQEYFAAPSTLFRVRWRQLEQRDYRLSGPADLERILCWGRLAEQHSNRGHLGSHIGQLWGAYSLGLSLEQIKATYSPYAWPKISAEYGPILERYDPAKVPITRKVATPERCLELEQQVTQIESKGDQK